MQTEPAPAQHGRLEGCHCRSADYVFTIHSKRIFRMMLKRKRFRVVSRSGPHQGSVSLVPLVVASEGGENAGQLEQPRPVAICRAPRCGGDVIEESGTEGHCVACGLHHRRRSGTVRWAHVIGPVVVTVLGSIDGEEEAIDADMVRFVAKYMTIEITRGQERYIMSVPASRLANIVARY